MIFKSFPKFGKNEFGSAKVQLCPIFYKMFPATMNFMDLANLLDSDGNMQNEMMVMAFAATMLATIPGN